MSARVSSVGWCMAHRGTPASSRLRRERARHAIGGGDRPGVSIPESAGGGAMSTPLGLAEVVRTHGRGRPDAPAITYGDQVIGWGRLDGRSNRVANALVALGVGEGDRIVYVGKNAPEYFELLFGAAKLGAVNVAINWRLKPAEVCFIADDTGATVLFVDQEFASIIPDLQGS